MWTEVMMGISSAHVSVTKKVEVVFQRMTGPGEYGQHPARFDCRLVSWSMHRASPIQ